MPLASWFYLKIVFIIILMKKYFLRNLIGIPKCIWKIWKNAFNHFKMSFNSYNKYMHSSHTWEIYIDHQTHSYRKVSLGNFFAWNLVWTNLQFMKNHRHIYSNYSVLDRNEVKYFVNTHKKSIEMYALFWQAKHVISGNLLSFMWSKFFFEK